MPNTRRIRPKNKEELLVSVRAAIEAAGGRPMTMSRFFAVSGMKSNDVYDHFASWNEVLRAAGLKIEPYNRRLDDATLLADWASVVRKLRRIPTKQEYLKHGQYCGDGIQRRAGSWTRVPEAFRAFARRRPQWKDILPLLPSPLSNGKTAQPAPLHPCHSPRPARTSAPIPNGRPLRGEHLGIGGMRNAPTNEMGVIALFTLLAERLGFQIETLQSGYPDCEASRRVGSSVWQTVRIEFEFESRKFRDHGHPPDKCDIIVCWVHNWPDCPKNLEVIELSKEVKMLGKEL